MPESLELSRRERASRRLDQLIAERPATQVIALAVALFLLVFAARAAAGQSEADIYIFYIVPVILLALRFGPWGGVGAALIAMALFVVWWPDGAAPMEPANLVSPALTAAIVGLIVGVLSNSLRRSERRFREAAENMLEPFVLYASVRDQGGRIVDFRIDFINQAAADSVGITRGQANGRLLSETFPGRLEYGLIDEYVKVVESGRPYFREAVDHINLLGEQTLVRAFDVRVAKLGDGIQMTWRDITDRVRIERQRDWLASVIESSTEAVLSVDRDRRIVSWSTSAAELYGYSANEAVGLPHTRLIDPDELEMRERYLDRVLSGERPGPIEVIDRHKDGTQLRLTLVGWPVLDGDGEVVGAARIVRPARDRERSRQ